MPDLWNARNVSYGANCPPEMQVLGPTFHELSRMQKEWVTNSSSPLAQRLRDILINLLDYDRQADADHWENWAERGIRALRFVGKNNALCSDTAPPTVVKQFVYLTLSRSENIWLRYSCEIEASGIRALWRDPPDQKSLDAIYEAVFHGRADASRLLTHFLAHTPE